MVCYSQEAGPHHSRLEEHVQQRQDRENTDQTEYSPFELALKRGHAKTAEVILLEGIKAGADMSGAAAGAGDIFTQAVSK